MRCCLYARFSTELQSKDSIADQLRECQRVADRESFEVADRFSDAAISGGTSQRPGYQSMLRAARRGEFTIIIVEDISRLWRSRAEFGPRSAELEDLGVHMITCTGDDTRRDGWGLTITIKQAMAEHARREAAYRTRRGLEGRARLKKSTGGRSYGYISGADSAKGEREIDQAQATIIREIFGLYASGLSGRSIAAQLNGRAVPSPGASWKRASRRRDAQWMTSAIAGDPSKDIGILNNQLYRGKVIWNKVRWVRSAADSKNRKQIKNPKAEWIEYQDDSLRIVSEDMWAKVKARQAQQMQPGNAARQALRKRAPGAGKPSRYLLSNLIRCGLCGAAFTMVNKDLYGCASFVGGRACTNRLRVKRQLIESRILESIKRDLLNPVVIAEIQSRLTTALIARRKAERTAIPGDVTQLRREIANLTDAIAGGLLKSSPALANRLARAEQQLADLNASNRGAVTELSILPRIAERCRALVARLEDTLGQDLDRSRAALREVVGDEIKLMPDTSGEYLWAEYGMQSAPLLAVSNGSVEIMVAGVGFEPTTFGL